MLALLMSNGNAFHSFGAAQVKERSPSIALHLKRGYRKSSIKPPGGLIFSSTFEGGGGLNREGGLKREGGLI